ncbi:cytochrome b561 [Pseudomonas saudimassiliensis]|uniref:Cytochrome b561 n=1 Tax=Pseudomonas saudimassiliensis TaxID=1461581 RepID=A0A078MED8_9PSED|nr:cytochrome b/b6 domain-containing protein [Pseudomonas saudimassiliensis]CEA04614.1 cytochrome b561 [Pseudomonas saudimassiliensis]CEF26711.1 cytochrome b561 [Pseudomonas saudimassiliensis]
MKGDSRERYGSISRLFHWGMGLLIIWQGLKFFDRIAEGEHWVGQTLVPWHISIGSLLLVLVILRIIWAAKQKNNRPVQDPATALLVKAGHFLLYAGMVLMPVTGILTMIGNGYGWTAFGVQLAAKGDEIPWMASLGSLHSPIAWLLLLMIIGHVGIALVHHFVKKDGVLRRMV